MPAKKATKETAEKEIKVNDTEEILKRLATIENKLWAKINEDRKRMNAMPNDLSRVKGFIIILIWISLTLLFKLWNYKTEYIDLMNQVSIGNANIWDILNKQYQQSNDLAEIRMQQIKTSTTEYVNCEEIKDWTQVVCEVKQKDNCFRDKFYNLICD